MDPDVVIAPAPQPEKAIAAISASEPALFLASTRQQQPDCAADEFDPPMTLRGGEDGGCSATVELASIMTTAPTPAASIMTTTSTPASPGPASPPAVLPHIDVHKGSASGKPSAADLIVPPVRPNSTPFPNAEPRSDDIRWLGCPPTEEDVDMDTDGSSVTADADVSVTTPHVPPSSANLNNLPAEIHEGILDHLFGYRVSATSKTSVGMVSWNTALRHPRRRELWQLALVSKVWRDLIQERLYRHIKLKATVDSVNSAIEYFALKPRLRPYVKHIEVWFPVFQPKNGHLAQTQSAKPVDGRASAAYTPLDDNKCALEEVFYFVSTTFPSVCVMTLEGGDRKKAPQVRHFIGDPHAANQLPRIKSIRTLVLKGQWNLARVDSDFDNILSALPNLQEWHALYSKPKSKSYLSMATVLPALPKSLTHLNLCLDPDYSRELSCLEYYRKVAEKVHFCHKLAAAAGQLEHISYTGRVCRTFFDILSKKDPHKSKIKTIDLTVKNCCRPLDAKMESGSGITDASFIEAFESLVLSGIRSLGKLTSVEYLRIRFVDLGTCSCAL